ncbi:thioredoxin-like protein [Gigaspora rosea]|uniref:Thioredoxin-like protein n=1 Tax=Gigaspora rosea TaxID=44941 RepID=A0A397W5H8_9GLOM|nr:thioredoxin-like protein [Gigaspora rosea]
MSKATILPTSHPIPPTNHRRNSLVEIGDHVIRTRRFRILSSTIGLFLCSLWVVAHFSDASIDMHTLHRFKNNEAAMVAASVMGDCGEEGIHSLEIQSHSRFSVYGHGHIHNVYEQSHLSNSVIIFDVKPKTVLEFEIDNLIHENPVIIFSKSNCPHSKRAKHILSGYNISPHPVFIEIDERSDMEEIQRVLFQFTRREIIPNVFVDGMSIGGSNELATMHKNGKLKKVLIEAGVLDN